MHSLEAVLTVSLVCSPLREFPNGGSLISAVAFPLWSLCFISGRRTLETTVDRNERRRCPCFMHGPSRYSLSCGFPMYAHTHIWEIHHAARKLHMVLRKSTTRALQCEPWSPDRSVALNGASHHRFTVQPVTMGRPKPVMLLPGITRSVVVLSHKGCMKWVSSVDTTNGLTRLCFMSPSCRFQDAFGAPSLLRSNPHLQCFCERKLGRLRYKGGTLSFRPPTNSVHLVDLFLSLRVGRKSKNAHRRAAENMLEAITLLNPVRCSFSFIKAWDVVYCR